MTATLDRGGRVEAKQVPVDVDRNSPVPLYHQVAEQLASAIHSGMLRPGDTFEAEIALAHRLDMSRPTVRRSIAELVTQGLLVRRRGVGTTVAHEAVHRRGELTSLYEDLREGGRHPSTKVLRLTYGDPDLRASRALQLEPHTPLVYIERVRYVDDFPIALMKNWLPPTFADLSAAELQARGLYELLRSRGAVPSVAHQTIGSRPAVGEERRLLQLGPGDAVLTMVRQAFDPNGSPLEFGDHCYRSDRYKVDVTVHAL
ncbi:MAG TPA: GntR family transcriptional regulator [Propionicimonas sp.]|nr:GntR family transcriptional regulator [Propionicimonas sp.]